MMKEMAQNKHAKTAPTTTPEDIVIEGAIEVSHTKRASATIQTFPLFGRVSDILRQRCQESCACQ